MNKNILISLFRRRGKETSQTKIFENLDQHMQLDILKYLTFDPDESPVVASVLNENHWFLITTKRTISYDLGEIAEIENASLCQVKPNLRADYGNGARQFKDLSYIELTTVSKHLLVEIEAGESFWGIYNILSHFADKNIK